MQELPDPIIIGFVGAPHGVRGTVRVKAAGTGRHLRKGVDPMIGDVRKRILHVRPTPKGYLVDLEGVSDRSQAAGLGGKELFLDRSELDEPEEDEFYVGDLIGMSAVDAAGEDLGVIEEVIETPAHEVLLLRKDDKELYMPFTLEHVPRVDLQHRSLDRGTARRRVVMKSLHVFCVFPRAGQTRSCV